MTEEQFLKETQRLIDVFSKGQWPSHRINTMWNAVESLDHSWWRQQVDNAVLSGDFRYNFLEAITFEKRRRAMEREHFNLIARENLSHTQRTEEGFKKILEAHGGANDLLGAIDHYREKIKGG